MTSDLGLFGNDPADENPTPSAPPLERPNAAAAWQIDKLRAALDAQGLSSMTDRQALIERLARRPVPSLRDLTSAEALSVMEQLAASRPQGPGGSSWDDRDGDTWIDKL